MIGKVTPEDLTSLVFSRTGAPDEDVIVGPAYGEDTAAIRIGDQTLVVNADPISLAIDRIGTLGVHVACNDVAASGARPRWLTNVVFLPGEDRDILDRITDQVHEAALELGVSIVGGHSEYAPELSQPLLSLTCFGVTDRYIPSSGATPGDVLLLTKGAAIEGTAILATDFRDRLEGTVDDDVLEAAAGFFDDISVVEDATIVGEYATAMHDPTEGGLIDGLLEVAAASNVALTVERSAIPIREETVTICEAMGVDPFRIFGSGALLAAVPADTQKAVVAELEEAGIRVGVIGRVMDADRPAVHIDDETYTEPVRDGLYPLWE